MVKGKTEFENRKLTDGEKATLFLYLCEKGLPDWAIDRQDLALALLTGWSEERAKAAFELAKRSGYVDSDEEEK